MEKTLKITIAVLVIIALGFGYLISKRIASPQIGQQPPVASPTPTKAPGESPMNLGPDEALILKPPPPADAKKEDISRYYAAVDRLAKDTSTIDLGSGCFANPLVARVKNGAKLAVTNSDNQNHSLSFDGPAYAIPPKGTQVITAKFTHGPGVYAYVCDANLPSGKIVGALTVTP